MFCKYCGTKVTSKFCPNCGNKMEEVTIEKDYSLPYPIAIIVDEDGYSSYDTYYSINTETFSSKKEALEKIKVLVELELKEDKDFSSSSLPTKEDLLKDSYISKILKRNDYEVLFETIQIDSYLFDDHSLEEMEEAKNNIGNYLVALIKSDEGYFCYDLISEEETSIYPSPRGAMEEIVDLISEYFENEEDEINSPTIEELLADKTIKKYQKKNFLFSPVKVKID